MKQIISSIFLSRLKWCASKFKSWTLLTLVIVIVFLLMTHYHQFYQKPLAVTLIHNSNNKVDASLSANYKNGETLNEITTDHHDEEDSDQKCKLPRLTPGGQNAVHFDDLAAQEPPPCTTEDTAMFAIDLDSNLVRLKTKSKFWKSVVCFYRRVDRDLSAPDFKMIEGEDEEYPMSTSKMILSSDIEIIYVWCEKDDKKIYEDLLTHTKMRQEILDRLSKVGVAKNPEKEGYSIQVIGLDSSSHMNFVRNMPLSHAYLMEKMEAIEFHGFNSIHAGTLWSTFGLFSGKSLDQLRTTCWKQDTDYLDECPFIWKEFVGKGYVTGFAEDTRASMFNMDAQRGFKKKPFDYDFRPFFNMVTTKSQIGHSGDSYCYGPKLTFQTLTDIALQMAHTFDGSGYPYFHFSWSNTFTHNINVLSRHIDRPLVDTLKQFQEKQLLNNTVLIVMSDHGMRYGKFRQSTEQGLLEERLPILYFVLPEKFHQKYPTAVKNLKKNSYRLTSAYDLHPTLRDLMTPKELEETRLTQRVKASEHQQDLETVGNLDKPKSPESTSLFLPVSKNRSCASLQINLGYCICLTKKVDASITNNVDVQTAVTTAIDSMNKNLNPFPQCGQLTLNNILSAKTLQFDASVRFEMDRFHLSQDEAGKRKGIFYEIVFNTKPGGGQFSALVFKATKSKSGREIFEMTDLHRINAYGRDGSCISDKEIRIYCHCQNNDDDGGDGGGGAKKY